jgi:LytS/YehU family sensor histidine kinase
MLLKFLKQWYEDQRVSRELTKVQLETELKFLKAQINPHFLFNSLNNLYALTLKKSDLAPEVVLRLSDILRYVLYDTNLGSVDIQKELSHLRDFIELERIRLGDRVKIDVDLVEPPTDMNIEPMLYLTLLENAFKHGSDGINDDAWVKINGYPTLDGYSLRIENSITKNNQKPKSEFGGIGLENLKKRLNLTYPGKFNFNINQSDSMYSVLLEIQLIKK